MIKPFRLVKNIFGMAIFFGAVWMLLTWSNAGIFSLHSFNQISIPLAVKNTVCYVNYNDDRPHVNNSENLKMIYYVTPTYPRPEQVPELMRLAHTLMHVPRLHWIVADDQAVCSDRVLKILRQTGLPFTHISSPKPFIYKTSNFPRGVANRRAALEWLHENVSNGILYFGDDDNAVDLQLFDEIRTTKKVSMFPVGLIGNYGVSTPIVKDGKVLGFFDSWPASRTFPVDMAGFAVNLDFLKDSANMPFIAGHEEDKFLVSLDLDIDDIEPLASNCTKILVWHTKTVKQKKATLKININKLGSVAKYHNFANLLREISTLGLADLDSENGIKSFITRNRKTYETVSDI
ncbi:galactosylgalactosylxylosylprotein 3-beta-glucuronosyltransferase S-like [Maniola jurtina]|uniref:galactosylgalactosylxylosylprotein 3-beta-glucuronosyltransferase S-like n=1 Tax=Maniola jurtina TaxID=191418 RepID=UPI001E68F206|nr:galactosylgalactosylxylosylprotein 3-beta-glucuronosyltransferase S-like [Maniola jurtina]